jgi:antitoxin component YwqK of YwqJK toxin-antitoxin module
METKVERTYHPNGKLRSETPRVGGKRHGVWKWWWPDGEPSSEVPYVGGVWHGMVKYWHQNGDIDEFWLWNQGEQVATFYPRNQTQRWKLK